MTVGPCVPWATAADVCSPCDDYAFDSALLDQSLDAASEILFQLSGRQFPGECEVTVRPCAQRCGSASSLFWNDSWGTCSCVSACACSPPSQVMLGAWPIIQIVEVKVDGDVLGPAYWRVDDFSWLVRLPDDDGTNPGWPATQRLDLPDTEVDTWSVALVYGRQPPQSGVTAAARLGCELALACQPETVDRCRLPRRVKEITRQGVSMALIDPMEFLREGRTGLYEVDLFLAAFNPAGLMRQATVMSPDIPSPRRAT